MRDYWRNLIAVDLILLGIILLAEHLLPQIDIWYTTWPLLMLVPGMIILGEYLITGKARPWLSTFGWWLILLSAVCFFNIYTASLYYNQSLFLFPLVILLGILGQRKSPWFKRLAWVLAVLTAVFLLIGFGLSDYVLAVALIVIGILVIRHRPVEPSQEDEL